MFELVNEDCLLTMKSIKRNSVDLIFCDLPYGQTKEKWDTPLSLEKLWNEYYGCLKSNGAIVLFGQEPFSSTLRMSNLSDYKYDWYWEKERMTNVMQVKKRAGKTIETISVFYKQQPTFNPQMTLYSGPPRKNKVKDGSLGNLIDSSKNSVREYVDNGLRYPTQLLKFKRDILTSNLHSTQKPLALCEYIVKTYTNENDLVLDNCMGSGTTGVACKKLNRQFIGIEKDSISFKVASERIDRNHD